MFNYIDWFTTFPIRQMPGGELLHHRVLPIKIDNTKKGKSNEKI